MNAVFELSVKLWGWIFGIALGREPADEVAEPEQLPDAIGFRRTQDPDDDEEEIVECP